ncbi:DUF3817 domain-containing protein [Croceiramulus getboli]|nr:DUF3817 domain-containing protein [Flavobacteriaceae bacterium YJPT1-3]
MIKSFRTIAILEGISFLIILFVTMPLKYIWEEGLPNKIIGMAHGILFLLYLVLAVLVKQERNWSMRTLGVVWLCSILPFGTFWMEKRYLPKNA